MFHFCSCFTTQTFPFLSFQKNLFSMFPVRAPKDNWLEFPPEHFLFVWKKCCCSFVRRERSEKKKEIYSRHHHHVRPFVLTIELASNSMWFSHLDMLLKYLHMNHIFKGLKGKIEKEIDAWSLIFTWFHLHVLQTREEVWRSIRIYERINVLECIMMWFFRNIKKWNFLLNFNFKCHFNLSSFPTSILSSSCLFTLHLQAT